MNWWCMTLDMCNVCETMSEFKNPVVANFFLQRGHHNQVKSLVFVAFVHVLYS